MKIEISICTGLMLNDHSNPYIESTTVLSDIPISLMHDYNRTFISILCRHESSIFVNDSTSCKDIKECNQYGDMEVFLLGLQLEVILPIFQQHQIDFAILLSMTDNDLKQVQ